MNIEDEMLNKLGEILINSAPTIASKIIMQAEPNSEGDVFRYKFFYINKYNEYCEYDPDGIATIDILDTLIELKQYYLEHNLTNGQPA